MQGTAKKHLSPETRNKVIILARNKDMRAKMTRVLCFSRQNEADLRELNVVL